MFLMHETSNSDLFKLFLYNWKVRDDWFEWCNQLTSEDLLRKRVGGVGSILHTLLHIIDVEYSWICAMQAKEDVKIEFNEYNTLEEVISLSHTLRDSITHYFSNDYVSDNSLVFVPWDNESYSKEDIIIHIITHEIHHIGQLSVWAREIGLNPVSASFIGRAKKLNYL